MNKVNYQKELDKILDNPENIGKKLLLHSCCAPCSSYVLTYLSEFFDITVFYYNPNIMDDSEYIHRVEEEKRLIRALNEEGIPKFPIKIIEGEHDVKRFLEISKGLEDAKEGGARCAKCFRLRLEKTMETAIENEADYFATTLTISPLKNPELINGIGLELEKEYYEKYAKDIDNPGKLKYLMSDFKKKDGYKISIELSKKYDLYRQNFCGCEFSKNEANKLEDN